MMTDVFEGNTNDINHPLPHTISPGVYDLFGLICMEVPIVPESQTLKRQLPRAATELL